MSAGVVDNMKDAAWPVARYVRLRRSGMARREAFATARYFVLRSPHDATIYVASARSSAHGLPFTLSGSDDHMTVAREILFRSTYLPRESWLRRAAAAAYTSILESGHVPLILDFGAHIGTSTVRFAADYPQAFIVAVEPNPESFAYMSRNIARLPHAAALNAAVTGGGETHVTLSGHGQSATMMTGEPNDGFQVRTTTVGAAAAMATEQCVPFLLKADIEGAEVHLFSDNAAFDFPLIVMEPHDRKHPGEGVLDPFLHQHIDLKRVLSVDGDLLWSVDLERARPYLANCR